MKRLSREAYLQQTLGALIAFFGVDAVKQALAEAEASHEGGGGAEPKRSGSAGQSGRPSLPKAVLELEKTDRPLFELLSKFFERVYAGELLPTSDDIRWFAEYAGMKGFPGKSRRDLVASLPGLLVPMPIKELLPLLRRAEGISAEERREGFNVLTDQLLRKAR